jgi:hypothetical protein
LKRLGVLVCGLAIILICVAWVTRAAGQGTAAATVTVGGATGSQPVASGFLGISMEYQSAAASAGTPTEPNPVFEQLVRNLDPGQQPVSRIGGDSTDHTWWPPSPYARPSKGLTYALTPAWAQTIARVTDALGAKLILGINLEDDSASVAQHEAAELIANGIHHSSVAAMELGNEPSLYGSFGWYSKGKKNITGRPANYSFKQYVADVKRISAGVQNVKLAGPALGSPLWMVHLSELLKAVPRTSIVTYHAYPMTCYGAPGTSQYPSIANLLSVRDSVGLAQSVARYAQAAHKAGRTFRVDELNSSSCGGQAGVSDTFASALWSLNTLFAMAAANVDGVNVHTFPGARYRLFAFGDAGGHFTGTASPLYYGLLSFGQMAPAGARLLHVSTGGDASLQAWATRVPRSPTTHVVLINDNLTTPATVTLSAPGTSTGTLSYLAASSATATSGVTLGGQSIAPDSTTGLLQGTAVSAQIGSAYDGGHYTVTVPAAGAAMLTLQN